jgi:hypothetical protein
MHSYDASGAFLTWATEVKDEAAATHAELSRASRLCGKTLGVGAVTGAGAARVVCVGDLHGNLEEARAMWANLEAHLGHATLAATTVVFLGDYCDRGSDTKGVIDWLIGLRDRRAGEAGGGGTHFIAGNHDFAFAAYVGALPTGLAPSAAELEATTAKRCQLCFQPDVPGGMHFQGRRWGGSNIYQANSTFKSYGVGRLQATAACRDALIAAMPASHMAFLRGLAWYHDQPTAFAPGRVVAVHAGLDPTRPLAAQLDALARRDLFAEVLLKRGSKGRFAVFSERGAVTPMHPGLAGRAVLVSGHHGYTTANADRSRIICDTSGGMPSEGSPIHAVLLPDNVLVGSTGPVQPLATRKLGAAGE